jgi:hypothetical protein
MITRPSPRATEASATSTAARISVLVRSLLLPQGKGFLHRLLLTVKAPAFNGLADKGLLIGGKMYFHGIERRRTDS